VNRKKAALVIGALLLIIACVLAFVLYKYRQGGDHRGSRTVEYVPTETAPPPVATPKIVWPTFGYDPEHTHVGPDVPVRPPFRKIWTAGGATLLEFPPAIGYGRLYLADGAGRVLAVSTKTGARAWSWDAHRCQAASPAVDDMQHGTVFEVFLNRRPCRAKRVGDGEVVMLRSRLREFSLDSVPGVGHYPQEERPQSVLDALARARAQTSGAPRHSE